MSDVLKRIEFLRKQLIKWGQEYYDLDKPTVSDQEYDLILKELFSLEKEHPEYITPDSPSQRVGGKVLDKFNKVKHQFPMLSLSNQFSYDDMKKFDNDIKKLTGLNEVEYNVEPKIDGLSISLIYEKGILTQAITRGDGEFGEDVTNNIKTIKTIPLKINNHFDRFEVRGEVFLSFKEFEKINSKIENEDDKFANPRNAAAGSLRNLDSSIAADRHLQMIAYYIPNDDDLIKLNIHKQSDVVATLKKLGFNTANEIKKCSNIDDVISVIEDFTNNREQIPYPIDGVVIKENNINLYDTIGRTSKFPKWATAYKFPPEIAKTKLISINATVGRTGRITYVASLEPVKLGGSIISSATLHNADYIINNDIQIGDIVKIFKAAEIIPKVIGPILDLRKNTSIFRPITKCPICNSLLEKQKGEVDQYCTNVSCPARTVASMVHFTSRKAMNVEDLSEMNIKKLYDANIIKSISDIYKWEEYKNDILSGDFKIKEKSFNNILQNINRSKNNSLEKLIFAIGIRHIGETTAKVLAKKYLSLDNLANASKEELQNINDVGDVVAVSIVDYFKNESNQKLISDLKNSSVNMNYVSKNDSNKLDKTSPYYQKSFVITGSFDIPRHKIKELLEQKYDANVLETVTKSVDYLIVGKDGGSKQEKANKLGIKVITDKIWSD